MAEGGFSGLFSRWGMGGNRTASQTSLEGTNIDRKTLEKVQKLLEKLVKLCDNSQLGLKRSPPYLLDLLPHMFQTLQDIFKHYDSKPGELNNNQYFRLLIDNICNKLKRGIKLFRDNRNVYTENSTERKTLTRLSLHISHMLYELRALFPNSVYIGNEYRLTKEEAADFWKTHFGTKCIVTWKEFRTMLSAVHPITSSYEAMALKSTIDLTHNDMVSIFEFDVFTRLFQPWDTLLINWKMIAVTHTGYQAFLTYGEVKERLQKWIQKPGTYIFRLSCTRLGQWAIGYVTNEHEILQTIPQNKSLCEALILGAQDGYYLYPDGKEQNPDLTVIQHEKQKKIIQVSEEEYEIYTSMGSTFQQCKICQENDKDVKLQPCAHLLCSECLFQWQEHDKSISLTCPFCRAQVKDYEHIEVDPFQRGSKIAIDPDGTCSSSRAPPCSSSAPPIPNRGERRTPSSVRQDRHNQSPGVVRQQAPPPPSIPRRPNDTDTIPPSRPPPLPPMNTIPKSEAPAFQPPTILSAPPPQPPAPLSQPPALHSTPGDEALSSAMSATNPFFSEVQALRSNAPQLIDAEKRSTRYADVSLEVQNNSQLYNNLDQPLPPDHPSSVESGELRRPSMFADGNLESITPLGWESGPFDNSPPAADPQDLYCNMPSPDETEESTYLNTLLPDQPSTSPNIACATSPKPRLMPLDNIALRPSSMIDPDHLLFEGVNNDDDIYENQNPTPEFLPPAELTVREKLVAQGYSDDEVGRAIAIVGDNYNMGLMILQSFVSRD